MNNGNGNHPDHHAGLDLFDWKSDASSAILPLPRITAAPAADRLEGILRLLLTEMGADVNNEHFRDTPARVARFYREFTRGNTARPAEILKTFRSQSNALVVVSQIDFFSLCPHHLLVYGGKVHLAYVPNGRIVGVSKIPRLVHALAARPVVQEALVVDIADAFMSVVEPHGCAVKAIGHHDCVAARGVKCPSTVMTTVVTRGIFQEKESLCREFDQAITEGAN
ncbi:MAG: GTP cyclohydrolase I [Terriglobia bacterium]